MAIYKLLSFIFLFGNSVFLYGQDHNQHNLMQGSLAELMKFAEYPKVGGVWLGQFPSQDQAIDHVISHTILNTKEEVFAAFTGKLQALAHALRNEYAKKALLHDAVFKPSVLGNKGDLALAITIFRGGRGGAKVTKLLADLQRQRNTSVDSIAIIVSGTDDGRSWEQGGQVLGLTGVPDMGKALLDLSPFEDVVKLLSFRLSALKQSSILNASQAKSEIYAQIQASERSSSIGAFKDLCDRFFEYIESQSHKFETGAQFRYEMVPLRSMLLVGAYAKTQDWQEAIDYVAQLIGVNPKNRVIPATLKRFHLSGLTKDGRYLGSEHAINETARVYPIEYLFLTEVSTK
ncbi:MAG: YvcK family protein [Oligoflexales bacterium]|nr:YvcK family protein [Oligoflexales bacterium]